MTRFTMNSGVIPLAVDERCRQFSAENLRLYRDSGLYQADASRKWRKFNGTNQLPRVIQGVKFTDGIAQSDADKSRAA